MLQHRTADHLLRSEREVDVLRCGGDGRRRVRLDLAGVRSKAALMRRCGDALRVPGWFGGNWDALADA
ncbi:barstar family protein, partial [Rhodococcus sp. NPDC059968]|uniref:barstar family protein n=1 Tax=Rhodococcus sp. NPDC059968 TaxID=3347017 RepID=UPI00366B1EA5